MDLELSEVHQTFKRTSNCPFCGKYLVWWRDIVGGKEVSPLRWTSPIDPSAEAQCPKCEGTWPVYAPPTVVNIREGIRESDVTYRDEIVLDNTRGKSPLRRKKTISHEWRQTVDIGQEGSKTEGSSVSLGSEVTGFNLTAETALKNSYKLTEEQTKTYSDEIDFEVPEGICRHVILTFRTIYQNGIVRVERGPKLYELPFRVAVGLELDVAQEDTVA